MVIGLYCKLYNAGQPLWSRKNKIKLVLLQNPLYTETSIDQVNGQHSHICTPHIYIYIYIYIVMPIASMSYQALDINPIVQLDQQTSALSTWALTVHQACPKLQRSRIVHCHENPNGWFIS